MKKNVIIGFLAVMLIGVVGYVLYDKLTVTEKEYLELGLDLYKFATDEFFVYGDKGIVTNYDEVSLKFTDEFIGKIPENTNEYGFCWPYEDDNGKYYISSDCGYGSTSIDKFEKIEIESRTKDMITYKITYMSKSMAVEDASDEKVETQFTIKKVNGDWKIDYFKRVIGLEF